MFEDKILAAIRAELTKDGRKTSINERTLTAYVNMIGSKVTDENEIADAVKPYIDFAKEIEGNINSVASEAVKQVKPATQVTPTQSATVATPQTDPILSKLEEYLNPIMKKVEALENKTVHQTYAQMAEQRLKDKVNPDFYNVLLKDRTLASETDVETFISQTESLYKIAQQNKANEALGGMGQPGRGNLNPHKGEASPAELQKVAASMGLKTKN